MKTFHNTLLKAAALLLIAAALVSCNKDMPAIRAGKAVGFTVRTAAPAATRTAYSGEDSDGKERIDWLEGDLLRITCAEAPDDHGKIYADYEVQEDGTANDYISGTSILVKDGEFGLKWSTAEEYNFYAVYPAPTGDDSFGTGEGSAAMILTGHVPAVQASTSVSSSTSGDNKIWTVSPDMNTQYMAARASVVNDGNAGETINGDGNVFLEFYPLTTAIRFTIENGTEKTGENGDMYIDAVSVISDATRISGGFTASLEKKDGCWPESSRQPICGATESGEVTDQEVKIDLTGKDVVLEDGDRLTFTIFLLPTQDVDDLTFKIYRHDKDGNSTWMSTRLAYNDATKRGVKFPCHKLTEVTGILVPDGAQWTVKYSADVDPWKSQDQGDVAPAPEIDPQPFVTSWEFGMNKDINMLKYNYVVDIVGETNFNHNGTAGSNLKLHSTREYNYQTDKVVWYIEYLDEESDEWKVAPAGEKIAGFVTLDTVLGKGDTDINIIVDPAEESETGQTHTERLLGADLKGTESAPYDLSMHTVYGDPRTRAKTANCYVVRARGWYAFPLVYGNAIDDNVAPAGYINVNAYNPGGETDPTSEILTRFWNCNGIGIRQPYIEADLETSCSGWTASPLWQDASFIDNCQILTASSAADKGLTSMTGEGMTTNACGYVMFHINDNIQQGNAVIAVRDGDSKILWSWHIWITDDELDMVSFTNYSKQTVSMLPVNLGWVDNDTDPIKYYAGKSVRFRINQEGSNILKEFTVTRRPETTASHVDGHSTFYQWGRKDPFEVGKYTSESVSSTTGIAYSIKNPDKFVSGGNYYYDETIASISATYYNLWSALNKGLGTASSNYSSTTIKTVYDPCPPGFQIPHGIAFTGMTITGANSSTSSDFNVSGPFSTGWYFTTGAGDENNFFKAAGSIANDGSFSGDGVTGWYWTSVPQSGTGASISAIEMDMSGSAVNVVNRTQQSRGCSVRPVMECFL